MKTAPAWLPWLIAAVAAVDAWLLARWFRRRPPATTAAAGILLGFVVVALLTVAVLAAAAAASAPAWRLAALRAGLLLAPLFVTAGVVTATSRRFRHAPEGPLLIWLGTLVALLVFWVGFS